MARVTVEDCVDKVTNRFELVALAAQRTKDIASGVPIVVEREGDKDHVVSLKEIALGLVKVEVVREELIKRLRKNSKIDLADDDAVNAENSDVMADGFDYIPSGSDLYVSSDNSDLESSDLFEDEVIEDEDKGSF